MNEAERLNSDCAAAGLNQATLQRAMQAQGEAWYNLVTERCPHLFADAPIFITSEQLFQMQEVIAAVGRVAKLSGWKNDDHNNVQHSALGVFYGYDFHLNEHGAHLIEINTNAGGAFLNALLLDSQREAGLPGKAAAVENIEQTFLAMFLNEWRLERGGVPLKTIAIVDEQPEAQYLYPEFLLAKNLFERARIAVHIVDPTVLQAREDGLYLNFSGDNEKIDLVYNRLTDFSLRQHPALRRAYSSGQVVLTPSPAHYACYADKRNLSRLTDVQGLRALGADESDIAILQACIPLTIAVRPDSEETL